MRFNILLACFVTNMLFAASSLAQATGVLKGRVTNARSKEPLIGAVIKQLNKQAIGTVTDADGMYSLTLDAGDHAIVCEYIGLSADTFHVVVTEGTATEKNVQLTLSSELLKTVVVSSGKFNQKLEDLTVSMEVLKPQLINNKNTTSIETALEQVPGITIIDNDPQIRGGSGFTFGVGSRVAIVVDGIPMLSGDAGRPEWNFIPVENIAQVEIIKGASSVLYGSSAINGVINVRMAYPHDTPKTTISYSAGGYSGPGKPAKDWYQNSTPSMMNLNFLHTRVVKKNIDVVVGGNFNVDQGYIGPPPPMKYIPWDLKAALKLTDSIPTFTNDDMVKIRGRLNFSLRYRSKKISGLNYGVNCNGMVNKTNMVFAWQDDSEGLYRGYPGAVFMQHQTIFNIDPFVKYNNGRGVGHSLVARVFYTDNIITNNQSNSGTLYYGEYQQQRHFDKTNLVLTGGIMGSIANSHANLYVSSGTPDNKNANAAGYIQLDKKFWKILNLSGGLRYEYFKTNDLQSVSRPIFRAGASVQALRGTWVRASYGEGFRYPTITERFISTKAGLFGVFPNPNIQPEESKSFEVGIKQGFKFGGFMGYIDVAGFNQRYHNTIEYLFGSWDTSVALFGFKFVNTGDSRVTGADVSLVLSTPQDWKLQITALLGYTYILPVSLTPDYTYAQTKAIFGFNDTLKSYKNSSMDTTNNILKYRFQHMVKADVEVSISNISIGVSYRYYSKMKNIDKAFADIESLTGSIATYLQQIKAVNYWQSHHDFHIVDARVGYKLGKKHKISLIGNNIFNTTYFLRPLKVEAPRTISLQYMLTF